MNAAEILSELTEQGVKAALSLDGQIKLTGNRTAITQWLPEIRTHKAELLALLAEAANEPETGIAYASAERLADDRRTCRQCLNLAGNGRCMAAGRGELPMTDPRYQPDPDRLVRCVGYLPDADDPDQRLGRARWPSLAKRLWQEQSQ